MPSRRVWWALMLLALVLRVAHAPVIALHHADELWQYLEPAHHLTAGPWVQTWEWRADMRSWLIPILLAGPMKLGMLIAPGSQAYILLPRLLMVGFSLGTVHAAMRLGARYSVRHAVFAGFVAAIWFELVYFGPRTLSEPLGAALFIAAAALLFGGRAQTARRLALAGFLLGAVVMVRFQFASAVLVLAAVVLWRRERSGWSFVAGGLAAVAIAGLADLAVGQVPYLWIWNSIHQNLVENRSAVFGVSGPLGYFREIWRVWSVAAVLVVPLAVVGARRYPVLMAAALVNLIFHSLIPHKEYRFVLLSTTIFVLLAALASVDLVERFGAGRRRAMLAAGLGWLVVSATAAAIPPFKRSWTANGILPRALAMAGRESEGCGLAIVATRDKLAAAWTFYGRQTPILQFYGDSALADARTHAGAFNLMLAPHGTPLPDPRYRFVGCSQPVQPGRPAPDYCLWKRPGRCTPPPAAYDVNAVLARLGS